jgi:hypothetical protein
MKRIAALLAIIAAMTAQAQTSPSIIYQIESNYQQEQPLPDQAFVQGAGVILRYSVKVNKQWQSLAGLGARWDARSSATSTNKYTATATVVTNTTPNYFQIALTDAQTGTAVTNWLYRVIVTSGGKDYPLGVGRLDIAASAWTGAAAVLSNTTAAAYTDAAVASHAAVIAASNVLGHVKVGAGLTIDGNGLLEATAGASDHATLGNLHWTASGHTGTPARIAGFFEGGAAGYATIGTDLELDGSEGINVTSTLATVTSRGASTTNTITAPAIKAVTSAGGSLKSVSNADCLTWGAGGGNSVSTADGLSVGGALLVQGTNVMTEIAGKVATTDATYTQTVALAAGALPKSGGTMTGSISMGTNVVTGSRFGLNAGDGVTGIDGSWTAIGNGAAENADGGGTGWLAAGNSAGSGASGIAWHAFGLSSGFGALNNYSHFFGAWAGNNARGDNRLYIDIYSAYPNYSAGVATNDTIFLDSNGKLYLGGGAARAENPNAGGVLRGAFSTTGQLSPQSYSATVTPTPLTYATNITISASNGIQQALTNLTGALTLNWPTGNAANETTISLTIPPAGTNVVSLGTAGVSYRYVSPLSSTNAVSTNKITRLWYVSPYGTTNAIVDVSDEVIP